MSSMANSNAGNSGFDVSYGYRKTNSGYTQNSYERGFYRFKSYSKTTGGVTTTYEEKYSWCNDGSYELVSISEKSSKKNYDGSNSTLFFNEAEYDDDGNIDSFETTIYSYDKNNKSTGYTKKTDANFDGNYETIETKNANGKVSTEERFFINGRIDEFKQGSIGDCWLLASLDSISTTTQGSNLIRNAISSNGDGSYNVTFKGVGKTYKITKSELISARTGNKNVSGDDDVLLLELAYNKLYDEVDSGKVKVPALMNISRMAKNMAMGVIGEGDNSLTCGCLDYALYPLTGQMSTTPASAIETNMLFNNMQKKPANTAATLTLYSEATVKDVTNQQIKFSGMHVISIQSLTNSSVTVTDPHNSSKRVTLSMSEFQKLIQKGKLNFANFN